MMNKATEEEKSRSRGRLRDESLRWKFLKCIIFVCITFALVLSAPRRLPAAPNWDQKMLPLTY